MKKPCLPELFNPIVFQIREGDYIGGSEVRINQNFKNIESTLFSIRSIGSTKYSLQSEDHDGWLLASEGRCLQKNAFPQLQRLNGELVLDNESHYFIPPLGYMEGALCESNTTTSFKIEEDVTKEGPTKITGFRPGSGKTSKGVSYNLKYSLFETKKKKVSVRSVKNRNLKNNTTLSSDNNIFGPFEGVAIVAPDNPKNDKETVPSNNNNLFRSGWLELEFDVPVQINTVFFAIENVAGWKEMKLEVSGGTASITDFNIVDSYGLTASQVKTPTNHSPVFNSDGSFSLLVPWKNSRGLILGSWSEKTVKKIKFSAKQDIRDSVVFMFGEARPSPDVINKKIVPIINTEFEKAILNGFIYVGPPNPHFVPPRSEDCPQLFVPEKYILECNELPLSASTAPYSSVYFSKDDGKTPLEWADGYYTDFLFETDYSYSVSLYGLDGISDFMGKRFPLSTLRESDGFWVGPSPDPYIKVRLTQPMTLRVNAISNRETYIPLIARGNLPFNEGVVDWGDGETSLIAANSNPKHIYTSSGNYTVTYRGTLREIGWLNSGIDKTRFSGVSSWGGTGITAISFAESSISILDPNLPESVLSIKNIFKECLTVPNSISSLDVSNVEIFDGAFYNYLGNTLPSINSWDVSNGISMKEMFINYTAATVPTISSWDVSNVKDMSYMFAGSNMVPTISSWDVENVETMESMFRANTSSTIDISTWIPYKLKNVSNMFRGTMTLNPSFASWTTSSIEYFDYMFAETGIANPNVSAWDMTNALSIEGMFFASDAANPIVTNWNTRRLKKANQCFAYMTLGSNVNVSAWNVSSCNEFNSMFQNSLNINPNITNWDFSGLRNAYLQLGQTGDYGLNDIFNGSGLTQGNLDAAINNFYENVYLGGVGAPNINSVVVGSVPVQVGSGVASRFNELIARGWVITTL